MASFQHGAPPSPSLQHVGGGEVMGHQSSLSTRWSLLWPTILQGRDKNKCLRLELTLRTDWRDPQELAAGSLEPSRRPSLGCCPCPMRISSIPQGKGHQQMRPSGPGTEPVFPLFLGAPACRSQWPRPLLSTRVPVSCLDCKIERAAQQACCWLNPRPAAGHRLLIVTVQTQTTSPGHTHTSHTERSGAGSRPWSPETLT